MLPPALAAEPGRALGGSRHPSALSHPAAGPMSLGSSVVKPGWGWGLTNKSGRTLLPSYHRALEERWAPETCNYRRAVVENVFSEHL